MTNIKIHCFDALSLFLRITNITILLCAILFTSNTYAVVVNTLNGVNYEWLDVDVTGGMSRAEVEMELANPESELYGYRYASRELFQSLLYSYSDWPGVNGLYGAPDIIEGYSRFREDFGSVFRILTLYGNITTLDGYPVMIDQVISIDGFYGETGECNPNSAYSCHASIRLSLDRRTSNIAAVNMTDYFGWDSHADNPSFDDINELERSHFLVKITPVPLPHAAWLFSMGLIGLMGGVLRK